MDWADTEEQAEFRGRVQRLIEEELPARYGPSGPGGNWLEDRVSDDPEAHAAATAWVRALSKHGWVAPAWPKEYGGAGLTPMEQFIFNHELAKADVPHVGGNAVTQIGPAIIIHGSDELKAEHLPKILSGERGWCQGFSEPGAGSDLASLQTAARREGDEYIVNGQKIWTSNAHVADYIALLVRTDPEAPKHRGISFLLVDMHQPGVTVRPLVNLAWEHSFNETFFEDVRVPVSNRVGEENRGWYVSVTLLDFERSRIRQAVDGQRSVDHLVEYLKTAEGRARSRTSEYDSIRHDIADRAIEMQIAFNFAFRVISLQARGMVPTHEASMLQIMIFETMQRTSRTLARTFGLNGQLWKGEYAPMEGEPAREYARKVSMTIAGGTSEIQRNVIATRGLGLPRQ
jgi:alkylation response protein AidB-like acyl-CoA dehydrogenase